MDQAQDKEIHELVEMECRELLTKYQYDGDKAKVIFGSALCASNGTNQPLGKDKIMELLAAMDENIAIPKREVDKPFLLSVESTF